MIAKDEPTVVAGWGREQLLQTLDNCGAIFKDGGVSFAKAFQWPSVVRHFAKGMWKKIWYDQDDTNLRRPIPDIFVGVYEGQAYHGINPFICSLSLEAGVRLIWAEHKHLGNLHSGFLTIDNGVFGSYGVPPGQKVFIVQTYFNKWDIERLSKILTGVEIVGVAALISRDHQPEITDVPVHHLLLQEEVESFAREKSATSKAS